MGKFVRGRSGKPFRKLKSSQRSKASSASRASSRTGKKYDQSAKAKAKRMLRGSKDIPTYSIPKARIEEARKLLDSKLYSHYATVHEDGCHTPPGIAMGRLFGSKKHSIRQLLAECRECLLNRDWTNLAALLSLPKKDFSVYFLKYAAICLLYCDEQASLDNFLHAVVGCTTDHDKEEFLKSLTSFCEEQMESTARPIEGGEDDEVNEGVADDDDDDDVF